MKRRHFIKGMAISTSSLALPAVVGAARYLPLTGVGKNLQTPCDTTCEVDQTTALRREQNFGRWKVPILNGTCTGGENLFITISVANFLFVLSGFAASTSPKYNGVRVYFSAGDQDGGNPAGLPSDQVKKLCVLFVPTTYDPNFPDIGCTGGNDDWSQCWWLYDSTKYKFPKPDPTQPAKNTAERWIYNYRNNKRGGRNGLSSKGQIATGNSSFEDTCCVWYNMGSIGGSTAADPHCPPVKKDCGIIGYVNDRLSTLDPMMNIAFGAYDKTEDSTNFHYYQIMSQFDFFDKTSKDKSFILGSSNGALFCKRVGIDFTGTTDTGLPCPPAPPCSGGS